ncbi:MAG: class I tRNA ligase family protein, partial [Phycisphaerales bacterium]|nr:class I tRNA ligase family protein [Phycisphaerales bacterium]
MSLEKNYRPEQHEPRLVEAWSSPEITGAEPEGVLKEGRRPYTILMPPPNVTDRLHLGHALNNTLQDVLVRAHRMMGDETLWMPGTDHAGISTQTKVEKQLIETQGKRRTDYERTEFIAIVQSWKDEYEATITDQLRRMGCSADWRRQRFTMDPICASAVREGFFRLFCDDLIYRGKRLVNWDPKFETAISDLEVENIEVDGHMWHFKYPLA